MLRFCTWGVFCPSTIVVLPLTARQQACHDRPTDRTPTEHRPPELPEPSEPSEPSESYELRELSELHELRELSELPEHRQKKTERRPTARTPTIASLNRPIDGMIRFFYN